MFIKSLTVKNLKCFSDNNEAIEFNVPDGTILGSGLNVLVGENGTGKTATLEAINYLTESHFTNQEPCSKLQGMLNYNNLSCTSSGLLP